MRIRLKRGKSEDRKKFIPDLGELIHDKDKNCLYVGDGETPGGLFVAQLIVGLHDQNLYAAIPNDSGKRFIPVGIVLTK